MGKLESVIKSFKHVEPTQAEMVSEENKDNSYFDYSGGMFDQLTLNDYMPGQGIPPHVDTHSPFEEVFAALSLKSGVTMHFKTAEGLTKDIYIKPRTLVVFSGEARYNWLHSISLRKIDQLKDIGLKFRHRRISLTFRKVAKNKACVCKWEKLCDSQNKTVAAVENLLGGEDGEMPVYKDNKE
jgi:alkylated DNA repair protein alkB family protein 8